MRVKTYSTSQPLPGKNRNPSICLAETCRHSNVSHEIDCPESDIKSILFRSSIYSFTIYLPPLPHCLDLLFPLGALRFSPFCTRCYIYPPPHPPLWLQGGCTCSKNSSQTINYPFNRHAMLAPASNRFCSSSNRTTCTNTVHEQHPHLLMNTRLFALLHYVHICIK